MNDYKELINRQRTFFESGITKDIRFRIQMLGKLKKSIIRYEKEIMEALREDLNKAPFEAYETEIGIAMEEIKETIKNLSKWAKPKRIKTPIIHFLSSSYIYSEPYGIVLIMSPWNYPFQLTLTPLIGAIAAGNCSIVKPSEYSIHTSLIIEKVIKESFEDSYISIVRGGREANKNLLDEKFDYIFFTGSVSVGKIVMKAASEHLTPITLELGGKSPCIVDRTADIDLAAKRIVWGKFLNAGQTCVAPDYLLVENGIKYELIKRMKKYITLFYGSNPCNNPDYPKIINGKHFQRLLNLLKDEEIVIGGQYNNDITQISPTIIDNVTWDSPVMQEEIFGPLLPVMEFRDIQEAASIVNKHPKPLALYLFSNDNRSSKFVIKNISFGGGCINDTIVHLANPNMPFGGVGESGMGGYHGKSSFNTFSHRKSILKKSNLIDVPLRYPPFKNNLKILKKLI